MPKAPELFNCCASPYIRLHLWHEKNNCHNRMGNSHDRRMRRRHPDKLVDKIGRSAIIRSLDKSPEKAASKRTTTQEFLDSFDKLLFAGPTAAISALIG